MQFLKNNNLYFLTNFIKYNINFKPDKRMSNMKLYLNRMTTEPNALVRVVMEMTRIKPEVIHATEEFRKTEEYKKLTVTDRFPLLVTGDGVL
jgi:hypothetical protein